MPTDSAPDLGCASTVPTVAVTVGQEFDSFDDFKAAMHQWAVANQFSFRFAKSEKTRNAICCRLSTECEFKVRALWKPKVEKVS